MAKKVVLPFLMIIVLCLQAINIYAADSTIRVGLEQKFKNVSSINFSDSNIEVSADGKEYYSISSVSSFVAKPASGSYLDTGKSFSTYSSAISYATSSEYSATPVLTKSGWGVYIYGITGADASALVSEKFSVASLNSNAVVFSVGGVATAIINGSGAYAKNSEGIINLNGTKYRGIIEMSVASATITAINIIDVEEYLYSVVPSEMPSSWNEEALKAQAVAARNYAIGNKGKHTSYDVCDNTDCQQYNGVSAENDKTTAAVNATKGVMAYYDGEIISALYFSSSGGHTISSKYAWGNDVAYLQGVSEINEVNAKEWERTLTFDEITSLCNKKGLNLGTVKNVYISGTVDGGNVKAITIEGSSGTKVVSDDEVRTFFSGTTGGSLYSRNFVISNGTTVTSDVYAVSKDGTAKLSGSSVYAVGSGGEVVSTSVGTSTKTTATGDGITLVGKGWGHSVGMSQYGANGMAEKGYSYKQILKYYYTGIDVK